MRIRRYALYALAGFTALAIGIWAAWAYYTPGTKQTHAAALWAMSLPDPSGKLQALDQWRGQVLVVNFWATWCAPCREEIPDFIAVRREYAANSVEMVGIAIDAAAPVAAYVRDMQMPYPVLIGQGEALALARELGNASGALPYTVVIDADGAIVLRHLGRLPRAKLQAALRQSVLRRETGLKTGQVAIFAQYLDKTP